MIAMAYFFIFLLQFGFFSLDVTILNSVTCILQCVLVKSTVSSVVVFRSLGKCSVLFLLVIFWNSDDSFDSVLGDHLGVLGNGHTTKGIKQPTNGFVDSKSEAVSLHDVVVVHTNRRI